MRFKIKSKGFTLVEIMLVLVVMMSITLIKIKDINNDVMKTQSDFLANNIKTVASATNALIVMKYNELASLTSSSGIVCATSNQTCSINIDTLKDNNLLPPNFSSNTILGKPYEIQLKRSGSAPNFMVSGLVLTSGVPTNDVSANQVLLGNTIQSIGTDGGINKTAGQISGSYGSWKADSTVFPILTGKKDYIGSVVGNLSGAYYVYLRRDGSLPMTGNLSLGGNDITNVKALTTTGNITSGNWVHAKNGYGDVISIGGDSLQNDYEIKLSSGKPLSIYSPNATDYTTVMSVNKNMTVAQRLGLMGKNPNDIPSGWTGGLRTVDVYADGTIGAGTSGAVNAYLNKDGKVYATGNIEGGTITSNDGVKAKGRIETDEYIKINGIATENAICPEKGVQSVNNKGEIMSCVDGKWINSSSGSFGGAFTRGYNSSCTQANPVTKQCSCPSSYTSIAISVGSIESCTANGNNCSSKSTGSISLCVKN